MPLFTSREKKSGAKTWRQVTADSPGELGIIARLLRADIHSKGDQAPHLDLTPKQFRRLCARREVIETD